MLHYGDPDFVRAPLNGLRSVRYATERANAISLDRVAARPIAPGDPWPFEDDVDGAAVLSLEASVGGVSGTSQMAAADRDGMMCSLCTTVGSSFGSVVLV